MAAKGASDRSRRKRLRRHESITPSNAISSRRRVFDRSRRSAIRPASHRRDIVLKRHKGSHRKLYRVANSLPEKLMVTVRELDALESLFGELPES